MEYAYSSMKSPTSSKKVGLSLTRQTLRGSSIDPPKDSPAQWIWSNSTSCSVPGSWRLLLTVSIRASNSSIFFYVVTWSLDLGTIQPKLLHTNHWATVRWQKNKITTNLHKKCSWSRGKRSSGWPAQISSYQRTQSVPPLLIQRRAQMKLEQLFCDKTKSSEWNRLMTSSAFYILIQRCDYTKSKHSLGELQA